MGDPSDAGRALREVLTEHVGAAEAVTLLERALRQATLEVVPPDRGRLSSFVEGYLAPLAVARVSVTDRGALREALRRVATQAHRGSLRPPTSVPPSAFRDEAATVEVALRRFADIVAVGTSPILDAALRPFAELGANLVRTTEVELAPIAATTGTLLVVLEGGVTVPPGFFSTLAARAVRTTLIVIGEPSVVDRAREAGVRMVVSVPRTVGIEELRAVVRLGPS